VGDIVGSMRDVDVSKRSRIKTHPDTKRKRSVTIRPAATLADGDRR
jgi:hypothetical protein